MCQRRTSVTELTRVSGRCQYEKMPKQALKNTISNTVKKQTGGSLALRMRQKLMNRRASKCSGSKARKGNHFNIHSQKEVGLTSLLKLKMIGNVTNRGST